MKLSDHPLEQPLLFSLSRLPFIRQKFTHISKQADFAKIRQAVDVGCGPGTNALNFSDCGCLGIDINERYIQSARRRFQRDFPVAGSGDFAKRIDDWKAIFSNHLATVVFESFPVVHFGQSLMGMAYFKGRVS